MTINQLPDYLDYAAMMPTPVIIFVVAVAVLLIATFLLFFAIQMDVQPWITTTLLIGAVTSGIVGAFCIHASEGGLAQFRAEAVSQHLDETYGVEVGFGEDGVQPDTLDGSTVRDENSVYTISVTTDGSILLVNEGGWELPHVISQ